MPTIKLDPKEYADVTVSFLLDAIMKKDEILLDHDDFKEVMKKLEGSGMKTHLLHMYLNMDTRTRNKYKMIRDAFTKKGKGSYRITIRDQKQDVKDSPSSIKKKSKETSKTKELIKKAIKMIKSHKSRHGVLITEDTLDKIIDKVIKENL